MAFKIVLQSLHKLFHGKCLLFIYIVFDSRETVCDGSDPYALQVFRIVSGAASVVVLSFGDAVVGDDGQKRHRHLLRVDLLDHIASLDLDIDKVFHLLFERVVQFFIGSEICRVSEFKPQLLPAHLVVAVVQCQLKDLGDVKVARQNVGFISKSAGLHTAACSASPCVFQCLPRVHQLLDDRLCVVERRLSPSLPGYLAGSFQEFLRRLPADLHVGAWLEKLHLIHTVQDQIAYVIYPILSVGRDPACIQIGEIRIGTAFLQRDAYFRRRRLIVELHPQTFQKFQRFLVIQDPFFHISLIEWVQMLVQPARTVGIPGIQFTCHTQMHKPVHLDRLPVSLRLMGRDHIAVGRDL